MSPEEKHKRWASAMHAEKTGSLGQLLLLVVSVLGGVVVSRYSLAPHGVLPGAVLVFTVVGGCFVPRTREAISAFGGTAYYVGFLLTLVALPRAIASPGRLPDALAASFFGAFALVVCRVVSRGFPPSSPPNVADDELRTKQASATVATQLEKNVKQIAEEVGQLRLVVAELSSSVRLSGETNQKIAARIATQGAAFAQSAREQAAATGELSTAMDGLANVVADALLGPVAKEN